MFYSYQQLLTKPLQVLKHQLSIINQTLNAFKRLRLFFSNWEIELFGQVYEVTLIKLKRSGMEPTSNPYSMIF